MAKIVSWNGPQLVEKVRLVGLSYVNHLDDELRSSFSRGDWPWGGETKRRNGQTVGTARNIVDTGVLRESQTVRLNDNGGRITWDPPGGYAAQRFRGTGYGKNGRPANWIEPVLKENPFPVYFMREWNRAAAVTGGGPGATTY